MNPSRFCQYSVRAQCVVHRADYYPNYSQEEKEKEEEEEGKDGEAAAAAIPGSRAR